VQEVIAAAQNRAKVASKTMPDCLGGGIGASSPVWMRDYSQPNDREPKNPKAKSMIGERMHEISVLVPFLLLMDLQMLMPMLIHSTTKSNRLVTDGKTTHATNASQRRH